MRKQSRNKPTVRDDLLVAGDEEIAASDAIRVGSRRWYTWLADHSTFIFRGSAGHLTARRETRRGSSYWYGYRSRAGKFSKTYLGKSEELTHDRLELASARLAGQTVPRFSDTSTFAEWIGVLYPSSAGAMSAHDGVPPSVSFLPLTKIQPPALPQKLVARPRLTQRISGPITLLTAPSGFGKSTLLNEWRQTCCMPVAWVSLDADDNHPLRFWCTIAAALQAVQPNLGEDLPFLRTPSMGDLSEIVVSLTNALVRTTRTPDAFPRLGLVLDDYHHIQDKEIHASLQAWLDHLPRGLQVIISSHMRPPLALGHLRAKGMVTELETDDLRFTSEEGIGFLSQHSRGRALAYADVQAIVKRSEGWAAGLTLASLALAQADGHEPVATFTGAHVFLREYFIENVLSRQPPSVQEFLLKTAILKNLTGSLCDAVTDGTNGKEMLSHLWQENLFLVRLEEPNWYRYHDLFAETLCSQLEVQFRDDIPPLHRRAAEWYRRQNAPADAIYHLLAIQAWEEAAALIEDMALHELEQSGDNSRLMRWLQQLPETVMQQHRTLLRVYVRVVALMLSRTEMNRFLTRVETNITTKLAQEQSADERAVLAEIQRIRHLWVRNDVGLSLLSEHGEHDDVWRMLDGIVQLARYLRHEYAKAEILARELYDLARARRHLYVMLISGGVLAVHLLLDGNLRKSERIARQVLQDAIAQCGKLPEPASTAFVALSQVYYERNELAQAHQLLTRASELVSSASSTNMPIIAAILRAKIQNAQGDSAAALATLQSARDMHARHPSGLYRDRDLITYQAWISLRQGDREAAERYLAEAAAGETHSLAMLVRAELALEHGQPGLAAESLANLIEHYPQGIYLEPIMGARLLLARALFEQHWINQAYQVMADVVRFASSESFFRPFLDYGRPCSPLLALVLHTANLTSESQAFIKQVLHFLGETDGALRPLHKSELAALSTAASITAREQQVLRLLSAGLSNREIATQLAFAESTVKTHLKNIYRKLGVNSRMRAAAQARMLKLA